MEITEVRIKLMDDAQERLLAFCSITFDQCFVIRDLKIIEGLRGAFVAMPSRKLTDRCPKCGTKNHLRAGYCNQCGIKLLDDRAQKDPEGRARLYADIAHPINARCREQIQNRVMLALAEERVRAQQPGYVCTYDDFGEENYATIDEQEALAELPLAAAPRREPVTAEVAGRHLRVDPAETQRVPEPTAPLSGPHFSTGGRGGDGGRERLPVGQGLRTVASVGEDGFGAGVV
jgi:stage V sporulation protein G